MVPFKKCSKIEKNGGNFGPSKFLNISKSDILRGISQLVKRSFKEWRMPPVFLKAPVETKAVVFLNEFYVKQLVWLVLNPHLVAPLLIV